MKARPSTAPKRQAVKQVATNLFRSNKTGIYYAIFKRKGRQVKCSLKTTNRELARRRLDESRHKIDRLKSGDAKSLRFAEYNGEGGWIGGLAKRSINITSTTIDPGTETAIRRLSLPSCRTATDRLGLTGLGNLGGRLQLVKEFS